MISLLRRLRWHFGLRAHFYPMTGFAHAARALYRRALRAASSALGTRHRRNARLPRLTISPNRAHFARPAAAAAADISSRDLARDTEGLELTRLHGARSARYYDSAINKRREHGQLCRN